VVEPPMRRYWISPPKISPPRKLDMYALRLMLKRIPQGWAVALSDGRELVRFHGLFAKRRALHYLATAAGSGR
jgi:hypothetical protein